MEKNRLNYKNMKTNILKIAAILLIFAVSLLFTDCTTSEYCQGFPENLTRYFPYQKGDTLQFENQNSDTISFYVQSVHYTKPYVLEKGFFDKCACEGPFFGFTAEQISLSWGIKGYIWITQSSIDVSIHNSYLYHTVVTDNNPLNLDFGDTIIIEKIENKFNKVIIIKDKGITEFYDSENDELWKKID
jgi:hypothetical protein